MTKPKPPPERWKAIERNIERQGDRVRVRMRFPNEPLPREEYFTADQLDQAIELRNQWHAARLRGAKVPTAAQRGMTVEDVAKAYIAAKWATWSHRSQCQYESQWRALSPHFGSVLVMQLDVVQVQDWLNTTSSELARNTVTNRLGFLRSILDRSAGELGIPNVARLAKIPRTRPGGKARKKRVLATDALTKLFAAAEARYLIVWQLMLALGLRSGEVRGLTLDRVDFNAGTITLDRQLLRVRGDATIEGGTLVGGKLWLAPMKAENSYATVSVRQGTLDRITEHVERFGSGPAGLIVTGQRGQPLSDERWSKEVTRVSAATGVALVGHDIRRTYGKHVLTSTKDIDKVAGALRNDVNTAVRAYLRPDRDTAGHDDILDLVEPAAWQPRGKKHLRVVGES